MKTFTTTLALVLSVSVLSAMNAASQLHVEILGHRPNMKIVFNGQQYMSQGNTVMIDRLAPGDYPIQVLRPSHWGHHGVVFQGIVKVPFHSKVVAKISRGGMRVKSFPMVTPRPNYWDQEAGTHGYYHDQDGYGHHGQHGHGTTVALNENGNGGFVSMYPQEPVCAPVPVMLGMHPEMFERLKTQVRNATFDSDQIRVAKQGIRMNRVTSEQVRQLMELVSFESSRLEIAKFGYRFVDDPENFFIVNDVFWFSSSIRELDRYINQF